MSVCYKKLYHLMIEKEYSPAKLIYLSGLSGNVFTRIKRNEYISLESLEKICEILDCSLDDIVEFQNDASSQRSDINKKRSAKCNTKTVFKN